MLLGCTLLPIRSNDCHFLCPWTLSELHCLITIPLRSVEVDGSLSVDGFDVRCSLWVILSSVDLKRVLLCLLEGQVQVIQVDIGWTRRVSTDQRASLCDVINEGIGVSKQKITDFPLLYEAIEGDIHNNISQVPTHLLLVLNPVPLHQLSLVSLQPDLLPCVQRE